MATMLPTAPGTAEDAHRFRDRHRGAVVVGRIEHPDLAAARDRGERGRQQAARLRERAGIDILPSLAT
jgi:hypothetical protein